MNFEPRASSVAARCVPLPSAGRRWLLLGAMALCLGLFVTTPAHAACGYYVTASHPSEIMTASSEGMHHHAMTGNSGCPCNGPECRNGNSIPDTTAIPPSSSNEQGVCLGDGHVPPQLSVTSRLSAVEPAQYSEVYLPFSDPPPRSFSVNSL